MRRTLLAAAVAAACVVTPSAGAIAITLSPTSASTPTVTLNGLDQHSTATVAMTVSGSSKFTGWHVTAWAPRPTGNGNDLPALDVPTEPVDAPCTGRNCVNPSPTGLSWPITLGTTAGGASTIYNAANGTGTGSVIIHVPFRVTVPANALPDTYTTTITLTITNAGP